MKKREYGVRVHYQGGVSVKERALLVRLRDSLGISEADAESIESELQLPPF